MHGVAWKRVLLVLALSLTLAGPELLGQAKPAVGEDAVHEATAILEVIHAQAAAWSRGDITGFMEAYENSPDTTFIGAAVRKGYGPILERYKEAYTTPEQMGTLTFSDIEVRTLPDSCGKVEFAVVTGRFHLERSAHGEAKKDDGIFSLVWRKGANGWKILLDHTS